MIQRICTGFDDHRQGFYSMVQALKKLHLHMQEKESVSEYVQDFKSLWATVETFGSSPGVHKGVVDKWLEQANWPADPANILAEERARAERESLQAMAACMIISGSNETKFKGLPKMEKGLGDQLTTRFPQIKRKNGSRVLSRKPATSLPRSGKLPSGI